MILSCQQLVEKVTDAEEGRLSALDRIGWAIHLAWCRNCRRYVQQMKQTVKWLRSLPADESAPPSVVSALLSELRKKS